MDYVLQTNNLTKQYRDFKAVDNLQMQIKKGAIYGLVGRNGAGKTTLIRLLCGLQNPTNGTYTLYGRENTSPGIIEVRKRMGAVVESPSIIKNSAQKTTSGCSTRVLGMPSFDGVNELLSLVGLESAGKKKAKNFSLGMRQRLGIAIALAGDPDFLILDEPANGLDPQRHHRNTRIDFETESSIPNHCFDIQSHSRRTFKASHSLRICRQRPHDQRNQR